MTHPLPRPVGPNSSMALAALRGDAITDFAMPSDPFDRDTQLAWFMLNETSFGGWDSISDDAEWNPSVVALRRRCEDWFVDAVTAKFAPDSGTDDPMLLVDEILGHDGPSLSAFLADHGTREQVAESLMLRLPYQYKEADPHTFAIPRLSGPVKRALCEVQSGEYGVGYRSTHAELFRHALAALDVDGFTPIVDTLPGVAFATSNLVTMGGLNRARRGIVIGQLALFEMDSVKPNGTMVRACDRLGLPSTTRRFFDVHVMADAEHEVIARDAFLGEYPLAEPEQADNVRFGIRAQHAIDLALAEHAIGQWTSGHTALCGVPAQLTAA